MRELLQLAIACLSLLALAGAVSRQAALRRWAPVLGLAAQPFWLLATWQAAQWGMFAVAAGYTLVWLREAWVQLQGGRT